jgi:hypothetical protein
MTLEELLLEKARLEKAMLRSESAIEFEQRRTEFRSYTDLRAQLDYINDQISTEEGIAGFSRVRLVSTHKDLA